MVTKAQQGELVEVVVRTYERALAASEANGHPSAEELQWRSDTMAALAELRKV